jgi:hypothetical protein
MAARQHCLAAPSATGGDAEAIVRLSIQVFAEHHSEQLVAPGLSAIPAAAASPCAQAGKLSQLPSPYPGIPL